MTTRSDSFSDAKELSRLDNPTVVKRCVKLKRQSGLQSGLLQLALVLIVAAVFLLIRGNYGDYTRYSRHYRPPIPGFIPYGVAALGTAAAALAAFFCIRNYYLLDPSEHRLYHCFWFLLWQRRRIVFRQNEILGITTEGKKKRTRYGAYWRYRLIAVGIGGEQEPLSNWRREGLRECNSDALRLADLLGCEGYAAPSESVATVEITGGKPTLRFGSPPSVWSSFSIMRVLIVLLVAILYCVFVATARR